MAKVLVTWGEEKFSPVQFNSFAVGPFSMEVTITRDMDKEERDRVVNAAMKRLESIANKAFLAKRNGFAERLKASKIT